jgi:hypothetical protein
VLAQNNTERVLHELGVTFGAPDSSWISRLIRLSWVSPAFVPCLRSRSLSVHSRSVSPPSFGVPAPPAAHRVPSSWIPTTSTACSALGVRTCCSPIRTGFAAFRNACTRSVCFGDPKIPAPTGRAAVIAPRNAVRTLRSIPLVDSRTASLRSLPSCRCRPPPPSSRAEARLSRNGS